MRGWMSVEPGCRLLGLNHRPKNITAREPRANLSASCYLVWSDGGPFWKPPVTFVTVCEKERDRLDETLVCRGLVALNASDELHPH